MKKRFFLKGSALCGALTVILTFCVLTSAATSDYRALIKIPTDSVSGWQTQDGTSATAAETTDDNGMCVIFSSNRTLLSGEYAFSALWDEFDAEFSDIVLKMSIHINDISALNTKDSRFALAGEKCLFEWKLSDITLKEGVNTVTLSLRTADFSEIRQEAEDVKTNEEDESTDETEEPTEEEDSTEELSEEEMLADISRFFFELKQSGSKAVSITLSDLSISVPSNESAEEPPEPITDKIEKPLLIIAIATAVVLISAIFVHSAMYTKKEIKKRKRELRQRKRERERKSAEVNEPDVPDDNA